MEAIKKALEELNTRVQKMEHCSSVKSRAEDAQKAMDYCEAIRAMLKGYTRI